MKISFILLCMGTLSLWATDVHSQNATIQIRNDQNLTIEKFIREVESQTNYLFVYSKSEINTNEQISLPAQEISVKNALEQMAANAKLAYRYDNDYIVLTKRELTAVEVAMVQGFSINGTVTDTDGNPLPGASVVVKGTTQGTVTGANGTYSLSVPDGNAVLVFSFVGFASQEITVGNQRSINITLSEDTREIEEVVVVGFGTQKKVNLTGAIATVDSKEFESRSITNAADALQGKVANLNVYNSGGKPNETANFNIRGYAGRDGTGGATYTPLVIVDGVTGSLNELNPNDIESITVLKDAASSAIYGAQAAYGVILVTTKSGKRNQRPTISYNNNFAWNSPTVLPKTAGSLEFAKLFRESSLNSGGGGVIDLETMERIEKYYNDPTSIPSNVPNAEDPKRYADWGDGRSNANEDWAKAMFLKWNMSQTHNISVQGGSERSSYMMSAGYQNIGGKLRYYDDKYERFNVATRVSSDVTNWLTIGANIRYTKDKNDTPAYAMDPNGGINSLINWIWVVWPTIPLKDPNGHFAPAGRMHYIAEAKPHLTYTDNFWGTGNALFKILPGLTANFDFTYNKYLLNPH